MESLKVADRIGSHIPSSLEERCQMLLESSELESIRSSR